MTRPAVHPPQAGLCANPLTGMRPEQMRPVRIGTPVRLLAAEAEATTKWPVICRFNGQWILRHDQRPEHADWELCVEAGDIVEFYESPPQGGALRIVLGLVIALVSVWIGNAYGAGWGVAFAFAANLALNYLIPLRAPEQRDQAPALGVFSTSLAGNAARLDQPIWKVCGRDKITPPFAAVPYVEYRAPDPQLPTVDCDQYYYAIFAIGVDDHEIEKAFIGKTPIAHFKDVLRAEYLPPGVQPSVAKANVVTSEEVTTGLELSDGLYVGPYAACRPGDRCASIGIDVAAPQGLGFFTPHNNDVPEPLTNEEADALGDVDYYALTCEWVVQLREINDFGAPLTNWQTLGSERRTADTNTPQRWTSTYVLAAPIRCEVRLARIDHKATEAGARDGIEWIGLRGYLERPAPLNAKTAHFEVVMRASDQLSTASQRDFSMIARAMVRTWHPDTGWGPKVFTRNAAWWLAALWLDPDWGEGLPEAIVDLQGLYDWSLTLDERQDHFDYTFTTTMDSWAAAQLIARSGRARAFRRHGVYTVARDEFVELPVAAFTPRNTAPKSMVLHANLPRRNVANGLIAQFVSQVTWDTASIECPCPGFTVTNPADPRYDPALPPMTNPKVVQLDGIKGAFHAEREGLYQAYDMALRREIVSSRVEMEGMIVSFMAPIRWQPQIRGYGQSGDVAFWDPATRVMGLTEPPDFSGAAPYLTLQRDDGSLTTPVPVTPGPTQWDVTLPAAPDFELVLDSGTRERPKFILGPLENCDELVKVITISDGGKTEDGAQLFDIEAVVDDERVHLADNHLLPGPGDVQDPIDDGMTTANIEYSTTVNLNARTNRQLAHGIKIEGINPDWVLFLSLLESPFVAWSEFASDTDSYVVAGKPWSNQVKVTNDIGGAVTFGAKGVNATAAGARAAFPGGSVTGSTSYTFWIDSDAINDNRGGLSILVEKD